jgi:hypothetical protein
MKLLVVYPKEAHRAYRIAAETFAQLAKQVSGADTRLVTDEDYIAGEKSDAALTVLIGNDAVNDVLQLIAGYETEDFAALEALAAVLEKLDSDLFGSAAADLNEAAACLAEYAKSK